MNLPEAMRIYVRVADLASFTRAAESLGLPKTSVSAAVQQLENRLGTRLLHRTTRRVEMTQDGRLFRERCQDLLADIDELDTLFRETPQALHGRLRVDLPTGMARHVVIPALPAFLAAHPALELELGSTDRRVDLVREGFDCVLRIGTLSDSSLVARPLGQLRQLNGASPAYVRQYGQPQTLTDLARHRLVHYAGSFGNRIPGFEYVENGQTRFQAMPGALTVNNSEAYQAACLAGLGIIQAPVISMQPLIAAGELLEVLPDFPAAPMPVSLVYAHRRHLPQRVKVFMDWLAEQLAPHLEA